MEQRKFAGTRAIRRRPRQVLETPELAEQIAFAKHIALQQSKPASTLHLLAVMIQGSAALRDRFPPGWDPDEESGQLLASIAFEEDGAGGTPGQLTSNAESALLEAREHAARMQYPHVTEEMLLGFLAPKVRGHLVELAGDTWGDVVIETLERIRKRVLEPD